MNQLWTVAVDASSQRRVLSILSRMASTTLAATMTNPHLMASSDALTTREPKQATTKTVNPPLEQIETEERDD